MSQSESREIQSWSDIPSEADQVRKYGFPLKFFRTEKTFRKDVIGGKNKKTLYSITGFHFKNLLESKASIEETFIDTINAYVKEITERPDIKGKKTTLVMHHDGLSDADESLFVHLGENINPGEAIISFIERFAQSNDNIRIEDEMDFDLWVSN